LKATLVGTSHSSPSDIHLPNLVQFTVITSNYRFQRPHPTGRFGRHRRRASLSSMARSSGDAPETGCG
ncbi:MAG: hypothetical protein WBF57_24675, partial [Mycobacterium sp.]